MKSATVFSQVLPVVTLLLGVGLARVGEGRRERHSAAQSLASLRRRVWDKGRDESWIDLQVYLGELRVALRAARVPNVLIERLTNEAGEFWRRVEWAGSDDVGWILNGSDEGLESAERDVTDYLLSSWIARTKLRRSAR